MIAKVVGTVAPLAVQLTGIHVASRLFPVTSGIIAIFLIPAKAWLGIAVQSAVMLLVMLFGPQHVPDLAILDGTAPSENMWIALLMFSPAAASAILYNDFGRVWLNGSIGFTLTIVITLIINLVGVFGEFKVYAGFVGVVVSAFMLCGYKVRSHFWLAATSAVLLFPVFAVGHGLSLAQSATLAAILLVVILLGLWRLPSKAEMTAAWDAEVVKLAVATKWNNEMWPAIERYIRHSLASQTSLPYYERADFDFVLREFDTVSLKNRDLVADMLLGLFNRKWSPEFLAQAWNDMIDSRDPVLKPETEGFKLLRRMPV